MKRALWLLASLGVWLVMTGAGLAAAPPEPETIFQISTIDSLLKGGFDGEVTLAELLKHGDTGIGTLDGLDGELLVVDGKAYQIGIDGVARRPPDTATTPFAAVTFFEPEISLPLDDVANLDDLGKRIQAALPATTAFYAVRIEQTFDAVKARSVPRQQKPYPTLAEAAKGQAIFEFRDAPGVMVGIWCPAYVGGVNVPGLHLHFLTTDKTSGGHVLDLAARRLLVTLDRTDGLDMRLPLAAPPKANENRVAPGDLDKIER